MPRLSVTRVQPLSMKSVLTLTSWPLSVRVEQRDVLRPVLAAIAMPPSEVGGRPRRGTGDAPEDADAAGTATANSAPRTSGEMFLSMFITH